MLSLWIQRPAVVRNQTIAFIHEHFDLESTMTMKRDNDNLQFEYMLACTERQLFPDVRFTPSNRVSLFLQMNGPIEQLAARFEWVRSSRRCHMQTIPCAVHTEFSPT